MSTLTRVVAKERKELIKSAKELKRVAIHNLRLAILHARADQLDDAIALVDCELNHLRMADKYQKQAERMGGGDANKERSV